jgi:hypothetical protein
LLPDLLPNQPKRPETERDRPVWPIPFFIINQYIKRQVGTKRYRGPRNRYKAATLPPGLPVSK